MLSPSRQVVWIQQPPQKLYLLRRYVEQPIRVTIVVFSNVGRRSLIFSVHIRCQSLEMMASSLLNS